MKVLEIVCYRDKRQRCLPVVILHPDMLSDAECVTCPSSDVLCGNYVFILKLATSPQSKNKTSLITHQSGILGMKCVAPIFGDRTACEVKWSALCHVVTWRQTSLAAI